MNWVRNNRFLAGFLGVIVVAGGVLGFLLFSSYGHYADVSSQYDSQVIELKRLQNLPTYPNAANLKRYEEVQKEYQQKVNDLQTKMASLDTPPASPPLTPLQFQDLLRKKVDETLQHAQTAGVGLPEGFYLGFEQYRGTPPDAAATVLLTAHLTEIQSLINLLIDQHIEKITVIKRGLLPQEAGTAAVAPTQGRRPGASADVPLVSKYPLEVAFTSLPSSFRESLNKITSAPELFIVRALVVKNQMDKGPSRLDPNAAIAGAPGVGPNAPITGVPNATGGVDANGVPVPPLPDKGPPPLRYVVGQERLDVVARVELTSVKPPR